MGINWITTLDKVSSALASCLGVGKNSRSLNLARTKGYELFRFQALHWEFYVARVLSQRCYNRCLSASAARSRNHDHCCKDAAGDRLCSRLVPLAVWAQQPPMRLIQGEANHGRVKFDRVQIKGWPYSVAKPQHGSRHGNANNTTSRAITTKITTSMVV